MKKVNLPDFRSRNPLMVLLLVLLPSNWLIRFLFFRNSVDDSEKIQQESADKTNEKEANRVTSQKSEKDPQVCHDSPKSSSREKWLFIVIVIFYFFTQLSPDQLTTIFPKFLDTLPKLLEFAWIPILGNVILTQKL